MNSEEIMNTHQLRALSYDELFAIVNKHEDAPLTAILKKASKADLICIYKRIFKS